MVQRELTGADLDRERLLELVRMEHPLGVLSIYVDAARGRAGAIEAANQLVDLERRLAADGDGERAAALVRAQRRLAPVLERLADPRAPGRGRALFAPLGRDDVTLFASDMRVADRVVLDARAFVHPLLELLELGRPAGVALLRPGAAELLDWRLGELRRVAVVSGEPARVPAVAAAEAADLAGERGWERILVAADDGEPRELLARLPERLRANAVVDGRALGRLDRAQLRAAVADGLARDQAACSRDLARHVGQAAVAALGLTEVAAALNEARAERVLYDPEAPYAGGVGADGALSGAARNGGCAVAEPRLTERIVERALDTGARLTPVAGGASDALSEAGGIAALLRW